MPSDKVIHHLETGVPLIVDEHPGGDLDLPRSKFQSDNDEASSFDSVVFMYGMFAGIIAQFATFGFTQLITNLVAHHGDAASMANILEDSTKMMYWIGVIVGITFNSATYFLFVKLLRIGFLDRNTRSSGQKDKEEEHEDNHMLMISTLELTFALGSLVSVLDTNS
jgi:H+/gluconate symporter-like permease